MKAYILTEHDMKNLKDLIEKWEAKCRNDYENAKLANKPEGMGATEPIKGQPSDPNFTPEEMCEWLRGEFVRGKDRWIVEDLETWRQAYASEQVRQARPRYDERGILWWNGMGYEQTFQVNKIRREVAEFRQERDALSLDLHLASQHFRVEREARERAERALRELQEKLAYENEMVSMEWSDRQGSYHPTEFWKAVVACSLDHSYDRVNDGIPYGMPEEFHKVFAPIVVEHLSAANPNWRDETVYLEEDAREKFESALKAANERALEELRECGESGQ